MALSFPSPARPQPTYTAAVRGNHPPVLPGHGGSVTAPLLPVHGAR